MTDPARPGPYACIIGDYCIHQDTPPHEWDDVVDLTALEMPIHSMCAKTWGGQWVMLGHALRRLGREMPADWCTRAVIHAAGVVVRRSPPALYFAAVLAGTVAVLVWGWYG